MKIYTKTGDTGQTDLIGSRVDKDDLRISTVGTLDEVNSILGLARSKCPLQNVCEAITYLQKSLFSIGAKVAGDSNSNVLIPTTKNIEETIDLLESGIPSLTHFILPGGHEGAALLHHARSVCRRAELLLVALNKKEKLDEGIITFMNRSSDFLFVLARFVNHHYMVTETIWEASGASLPTTEAPEVAKTPEPAPVIPEEIATPVEAQTEKESSSMEVTPPVIEKV